MARTSSAPLLSGRGASSSELPLLLLLLLCHFLRAHTLRQG
jgi:hypothetical protein